MQRPPLVLIVDDEPEFREIMSAKLKDRGYWVAEASDGTEAVRKAQALKPGLIIMDINMPNEGGTEAVLDLKNDPATKDAKIIFLSSMKQPWPGLKGGKDRPEIARFLGAADFIDKEDDVEVNVRKIESLLPHP